MWFVRWVTEAYCLRQLAQHSGWSLTTLTRIIHKALMSPPPQIAVCKAQHITFDGTYIYKRVVGAMVVMDGLRHELIAGRFGLKESVPYLVPFFEELKDKGLSPVSVTVDGNPQAITAFQSVWPQIVIQRCLVHIQRQGLMWCRARPKRTDAKKLRELFLQVTSILTIQDRDNFLSQLASWEARYGERIRASPEAGWVASDLKRARSMLLSALPNMFHYLENPFIAWNTNLLEGYFSRMKQCYRGHNGLARHRLRNYFNWYFYLCRK